MVPGAVVDGRYRLVSEAGRGGMGVVYRADDLEDGDVCAVKIMRAKGSSSRFLRELDVLTCLQHPGIVSLRSSGIVDDECPYFAMEWIDGVTLGAALERGPLDAASVATAATRLADALAYAHRMGVLHRDITPANIMLRGGEVSQPCFIDFGLARRTTGDETLTRTDVRIGTPRYMPPEVVRGQPATSASDVYSFGCVLYECLTGTPAHVGTDVLALLASIAIDQAPNLSAFAERVPSRLRILVERMLSKVPSDRPVDGNALLGEMAQVERAARPSGRLPAAVAPVAPVGALVVGTQGGPGPAGLSRALSDAGARHAAELAVLPDGGWLLFVPAAGDAVAVAVRACSLADDLALRPEVGAIAVAIDGLGANRQLSRGASAARALEHLRASADNRGVWLDATAVSLLAERVSVSGSGLFRRREEAAARRSEPTAVVGEERERLVLRARTVVEAALRSGRADTLVVTGPAGIGKSYVIERALDGLSVPHTAWRGRGEPVAAGEPFHALSSLLSGGLSLPPEVSSAELERALTVAGIRCEHGLTTTLMQLPGLGARDATAPLTAERLAPQLADAWVSMVRDLTLHDAVAFVVEDAQWCDPASLHVLRRVLDAARTSKFCLVAATRTEGLPLVDRALRGLAPTRIHVDPLGAEAAREVARHAARGALDEASLDSIVARAGGIPYFVRELARAHDQDVDGVAKGGLPLSVEAVVRARLVALPGAARSVLCHAAVLGEAFTRGPLAVDSLLVGEVDAALVELLESELLLREGDHRYRFSHGLVREAAEALLSDEERAAANLRAGEWLAVHEPLAHARMAVHFEAAGRPDLADPHALAVATSAVQLADMDTARRIVTRCLTRPLAPKDAARAHLVRALIAAARQESGEAEAATVEAMRSAAVGSSEYCRAAAVQLGVISRTRGSPAARPVAERLVARLESAAGRDGSVDGMMGLAANILAFGHRDAARQTYLIASRLLARHPDVYATGLSFLYRFYETASEVRCDDTRFSLDEALEVVLAAEANFVAAGHLVMVLQARANLGWIRLELGDFDAAAATLRAVALRARDLGQQRIERHVRALVGGALAFGGHAAEAEGDLVALMAECEEDPFHRSIAAMNLSITRLARGALVGAASAGEEAVALMETYRREELPKGRGVLSAVWHALGKHSRALELAERAIEDHEGRSLHWGDAYFARRTSIDARGALGDEAGAAAAAADLKAVLDRRAAAMADARLRTAYLNHPSHCGFQVAIDGRASA